MQKIQKKEAIRKLKLSKSLVQKQAKMKIRKSEARDIENETTQELLLFPSNWETIII